MRTLILIIISFLIASCEHKPEFYIAGRAYYTEKTCVKSHTETEYCYHYGFSYAGKWEYFYGNQYTTVCDSQRVDTIAIIPNK